MNDRNRQTEVNRRKSSSAILNYIKIINRRKKGKIFQGQNHYANGFTTFECIELYWHSSHADEVKFKPNYLWTLK
jgi:hypothetical protein